MTSALCKWAPDAFSWQLKPTLHQVSVMLGEKLLCCFGPASALAVNAMQATAQCEICKGPRLLVSHKYSPPLSCTLLLAVELESSLTKLPVDS